MWIHVDDSAKPSAHSSISVYKHLFVAGMMIDVESQCGSFMRESLEYIHVAMWHIYLFWCHCLAGSTEVHVFGCPITVRLEIG